MSRIEIQASKNYAFASLLLAWSACILMPIQVLAQSPDQIDLARPGDREFILDKAGLINEGDALHIRQVADKLLTAKAAPIVVVTVESMANYAGSKLRIETFARLLFDQWEVGPQKLGNTPWNHGILLVVSRDDRVARIELGAGWKRDKDLQTQEIMDNVIVPQFKRGNFSGGITQGVEALDRMARDLNLPNTQRPASGFPQNRYQHNGAPSNFGQQQHSSSDWILPAILIFLALFTIVSLSRNGSNGWAWLFWSVIFGVIGSVLFAMLTNHSRRSGGFFSGGGGSFGGGSFGGGFSGGGGASGSW